MGELPTIDRVLPFAILLLPLAGFTVLALFGDWIKREKEDDGAAYLACGTVLAAFGLARLDDAAAVRAAGRAKRGCASPSPTSASSGWRRAASACR